MKLINNTAKGDVTEPQNDFAIIVYIGYSFVYHTILQNFQGDFVCKCDKSVYKWILDSMWT